jgi:hypothetical protein
VPICSGKQPVGSSPIPYFLGVASRRDVQFSLLLNIRYLFRRTVKRNVQALRAKPRTLIEGWSDRRINQNNGCRSAIIGIACERLVDLSLPVRAAFGSRHWIDHAVFPLI